MVKKTINAVACALFAPLALAQTSTRTTDQTTATQRTMRAEATTASTSAAGTVVTTYEPGKLVVVGSEGAQNTFTFVLDKTVRYVNKAGRNIDEHLIKSGTRIRFYYDGTGKTHVINGVVGDKN